MNERIKELMYQAGVQEDLIDNLKDEVEVLTYIARPRDMQKFAELIVQECIDKAFHNGHPDLEFLLKHFGVE